MRSVLLILFALSAGSGCANQQLRFSTLRQTSTLPDVQEIQVLENFARLAANPGNLPFYSVVNGGTASVSDMASTSLAVTAVHKAFPSWSVTPLSANRSITENWTLVPENNPDRLKVMRAAYLTVVNPAAIEPSDSNLLQAAIQMDPSYELRQGWIQTGGRWDVPKNACRVAHCGSVYVWVMPEYAAEFSRFVLLILQIEKLPSGGGAAAGGAAAPGTLPSSPFAPGRFDQPPGVNSGLFFLPRR